MNAQALAARFYNYVTDVQAGASYRVTAQNEWWDWRKRAPPTGYEGNWFMALGKPLRRDPHAPWFALVGVIAICDGSSRSARIVEGPLDLSPFLGPRRPWRAAHSGRLYVFANDVPLMYFNNRGAVRVTLVPVDMDLP